MKNTIRLAAAVVCLFTAILAAPMAMAQNTATLPLVLPVTDGGRHSFVRIVNLSGTSGTINITAIDDTGDSFGPATLSLESRASVHLTSRDLEQGRVSKGLPVGVGDGEGNWRLEFESNLDFEALAYIRTLDGFLTSIHDTVPVTAGTHRVLFFNPASNISKQSRLRLVNSGTAAAEVTISARDDAGEDAPGGDVSLTVPAGESRTLTAQALEAGGDGFTGSFGDGTGKWRLSVTSNVPIEAMSLLSTSTGHLANLSTVPVPSINPETLGPFQAPEMVTIPAGSFMMGSTDSETNRLDNEGPVHKVTIAYSFDVGKYEVTRGEFARFVSETGYTAAGNLCWLEPTTGWTIEHNWRNPGFTQTDDHPVVCVTWFDAKAYVAWLSEKTGDEYRLLTESEWEYVARGGTTTPWFWGDSSEMQCRYANALDASTRVYPGGVGCNDGYSRTAPVGSYRANPFGVHDMAGNVIEWVEDCGGTYRCLSSYEPGTDRDGNATPPVDGSAAPEWGTWRRARRGGSWGSTPQRIRSAWRGYLDSGGPIVPSYLSDGMGFRIARTLATTPPEPEYVCPAEIEVGAVFVQSTNSGTARYRILSGSRFLNLDDPADSGTYTYRRTGPTTATYTSTIPNIERCDGVLTCTTMSEGTFRTNCNEFGVGTYVISGTWEIQAPTPDDDHGNTPATATPVRVPSTTAGNLETIGDNDYFRFDLPSNGHLRVYTTGNTNTYGSFYRGNDFREGRSDRGTGNNFRIDRGPIGPGMYYIEVSSAGTYPGGISGTGAYRLHVEFSESTTPPEPPTQTGPPPPVVDVRGEYNPGLRIGYLLLGIYGARISEGVTRIRGRYRPAGRSWWVTTIWTDLWCGDLRCRNYGLEIAEEVDPGTYEVQFQAGFAPPSTSVSTWSESVLVAVPSS